MNKNIFITVLLAAVLLGTVSLVVSEALQDKDDLAYSPEVDQNLASLDPREEVETHERYRLLQKSERPPSRKPRRRPTRKPIRRPKSNPTIPPAKSNPTIPPTKSNPTIPPSQTERPKPGDGGTKKKPTKKPVVSPTFPPSPWNPLPKTLISVVPIDATQEPMPSITRHPVLYPTLGPIPQEEGDGLKTLPPEFSGSNPVKAPTPTGKVPILLGASFSSHYGMIRMEFDRKTDRGRIAGLKRTFPCSKLIKNSENLAGTNARCRFISDRNVAIDLRKNAKVVTGDKLSLVSGVVRAYKAQSIKDEAARGSAIVKVSKTLNPRPRISGPDSVGIGDSLRLDATGSTGSGGRPFMDIQWSLEDGPEDLQSYLLKNEKSLRLIIPSRFLKAGDLNFRLSLTNFLSRSRTITHAVTVNKLAQPSIEIVGGKSQDFVKAPGKDLIIRSRLTRYTSQGVDWREYDWKFKWSLLDGGLQVSNNDPQKLIVLGESLETKRTYRFKVEMTSGSITVSAIAVIFAREVPLNLIVHTSSKKVGIEEQVEIDASSSYDPNFELVNSRRLSETIQFSWECLMLLESERPNTTELNDWPTRICRNITGDRLEIPRIEKLVFPPFTLLPEATYYFTPTIFSGNRNATSSPIAINVTQDSIPQVRFVNGVPEKINFNHQFLIEGNVLNNIGRTKFDCEWKEATGSLDLLSFAAAPVSNLNLVIRPYSLLPGTTYTFSLTCADYYGNQGFALTTVKVNDAPTSGLFNVFPSSSGTAILDSFTLSSQLWADDDEDLPLEYSFSYLSEYYKYSNVSVTSALTATEVEPIEFFFENSSSVSSINASEILLSEFKLGNTIDTGLPWTCLENTHVCEMILVSTVIDQLGATSKVGVSVTLNIPNESEAVAIFNSAILNTFDIQTTEADEFYRDLSNIASLVKIYPSTNVTSLALQSLLNNAVLILNQIDFSDQLKILVAECLVTIFSSPAIPKDTIDVSQLSAIFSLLTENATSNEIAVAIADSISNLISSNRNISLSLGQETLRSLSVSQANSMLSGAAAYKIDSPSFSLVTEKFSTSLIKSDGLRSASLEQANFVLPRIDFKDIEDAISTRVLEWTESPYENPNASSLITRVLEFTLTAGETDIDLELQTSSTENSLQIELPIVDYAYLYDHPLQCGFYNRTIEAWSTYGCEILSQYQDGNEKVYCACNHTTDFAAWAALDDVLKDTITFRERPTKEHVKQGYIIIVFLVLFYLVMILCLWRAKKLDSIDSKKFQRAIYVYVIKRYINERAQLRKGFNSLRSFSRKDQLTEIKRKTVKVTKPQTQPPITHTSWIYVIKMNSRAFSVIFNFDPIFTRFDRALILFTLLIGKLFLSACFYHFRKREFLLIDRFLIIVLTTVFFTILALVASATLSRIPPNPEDEYRYIFDMKTIANASKLSNKSSRNKLVGKAGVNLSEWQNSHDMEIMKHSLHQLICQVEELSREHNTSKSNLLNRSLSRNSNGYIPLSKSFSKSKEELLRRADILSSEIEFTHPELSRDMKTLAMNIREKDQRQSLGNRCGRLLFCCCNSKASHLETAHFSTNDGEHNKHPSMKWFYYNDFSEVNTSPRPKSSTKTRGGAEILGSLKEKPVNFLPWWIYYMVHGFLILFGLFCTVFLLSWGLTEGNDVLVYWIPNMIFSAFLSLLLMDPLMVVAKWILRRRMEKRTERKSAKSRSRDVKVYEKEFSNAATNHIILNDSRIIVDKDSENALSLGMLKNAEDNNDLDEIIRICTSKEIMKQ